MASFFMTGKSKFSFPKLSKEITRTDYHIGKNSQYTAFTHLIFSLSLFELRNSQLIILFVVFYYRKVNAQLKNICSVNE